MTDPLRGARAAGAPSNSAPPRNRDPRPGFSCVLSSSAVREITDLLLSTKTKKRALLLKHVNHVDKQLPFKTVAEFNDWLLPEKVGLIGAEFDAGSCLGAVKASCRASHFGQLPFCPQTP